MARILDKNNGIINDCMICRTTCRFYDSLKKGVHKSRLLVGRLHVVIRKYIHVYMYLLKHPNLASIERDGPRLT